MLQAPLFADMAQLSFWDASLRCLHATVGDVAITLAAYATVAAWVRTVSWIRHADTGRVASFCIVAFGLSTLIERHSVAATRWMYAPDMPIVPWLGIGLAPAAQWLFLPLLSLAVGRSIVLARQDLSSGADCRSWPD